MSLVWNIDYLIDFRDIVLPDLVNDEVFVAVLVARKKYCKTLPRSEEILDLRIIKRKEDFVRKIRRFLRVSDVDFLDKNGNYIPKTAMAAYIDIYPKSCLKALKEFNDLIKNWMYDAIYTKDFPLELFRKIDTKLKSSIHKTNSRKPHKIVDIDSKDESLIKSLPDGRRWITETKNGFHVIYLNPDSELMKELHQFRQAHKNSDVYEFQWHQGQTVIPGTLQGGFAVRGWLDE